MRAWDASGSGAEVERGAGHLTISDLRVRLFDPQDGTTVQLILESPRAEFFRDGNQACGENFIHLVGNLFTVIGGRWTFFGADPSVILERDVQVFFETNLARALASGEEGGFTVIGADSLQVIRSADGFSLEFLQNVVTQSDELLLTCDRMVVETVWERPLAILEEKSTGEAIRRIHAQGHVHFEEARRHMEADGAELFPREGLAVLSGRVCVTDGERVVRGRHIVLRRDALHVLTDGDGVVHRDISLDVR
ncbi:MAG: LptA/OstA family protein [Puniceicoccales bacterium]|nr:LptA/OstA family protein [Puniceicoccales bacterium]